MMGNCIFYTDRSLNITSWGKGISIFTGHKPSEVIGKKYYKVINRIKLGNSDALSTAITKDQIIVFKDYRIFSARGEVKTDIVISPTRDKDGIIQGVRIKIAHDPSRFCVKDVSSFSHFFDVAPMVHGLRGSLNTIKGVTQYLRDSRSGNSDIKEYTDFVDEAINHMKDIISRLLNLPRERFDLSDINMNNILRKLKPLISSRAAKNKIKTLYCYKEIPTVKADSYQIQQALINVVENAIEAMPEGGELRVTTGIEHLQEGDFIVITVSDTGHGFKSDKRGKRYDNIRGFGLTLTRLVLHYHGGCMKITEDRTGTTVKLYLPVEGR